MLRSRWQHQEVLAALLHGVDAPGALRCRQQLLASPSTKTLGGCWFPAAGRGGLLHLGLLPIRHGSSLGHNLCGTQPIQHTTYLLEPANGRGKPPGSGRCCRLPSRGSCPSPPHRQRMSIPLQLAHHGEGKAEAGTWPHTGHSTEPRWLHRSAPSPPRCWWPAQSYTPTTTATHRDGCSPIAPRPAQLHWQLRAAAARRHESPAKTTLCLVEPSPLHATG